MRSAVLLVYTLTTGMHEDARRKQTPDASDGPATTSAEAVSRSGAPAPGALRHGGAPAPSVDQLRTFLSHLKAPHRLDTPQIRALLAAHRRLPPTLSPAAVGAAAAELFAAKIAALDPGPEAPASQRLPHEVLHTCFVRGRKNFQAAAELGLSERQLTRERERAVRLLAGELAAPPFAGLEPEPIPTVEGHIRRPDLLRCLTEAASGNRLVSVTGEPGAGKTSLVAALAHAQGSENVWWHTIRRGLNDSLEALLLELGHVLAREGASELRDYLERPGRDVAAATRLALAGFAGRRRLLVFDDFANTRDPKSLGALFQEAVERLGELSVVTIGGAALGTTVVQVPALTRAETAQLLRAWGVGPPGHVIDGLYEVSRGNIRMVAAVAAWWSGHPEGLPALQRHISSRDGATNLAAIARLAAREAA